MPPQPEDERERGRAHRNPNLARTRVWIGEIHDLENLQVRELVGKRSPSSSLRFRPEV